MDILMALATLVIILYVLCVIIVFFRTMKLEDKKLRKQLLIKAPFVILFWKIGHIQ